MASPNTKRYIIPSLAIVISVVILGFFLKSSIISFKEYERTVTVKGLAEQEYPANIVIWPIRYTEAGNNLEEVYTSLDNSSQTVKKFW